MKKGKVFFHPIEGTGSLTISWSSSPKGDAIEAKRGSGVGFFSDEGSLLAVVFDEVKERQDSQILDFDQMSIEIRVKAGKIDYEIIKKPIKTNLTKKNSRKKSSLPK